MGVKLKYGLIFIFLITGFYLLIKGVTGKQIEKPYNLPSQRAPNIVVDTTEDERALGYSGQKKIAADLQGNLYIGYRKKSEQFYQIYVSKVTPDNNGNWKVIGNDQPISSATVEINQRVPSLFVDAQKNIHVVWYGADYKDKEGDRQIKYSRSQDEGKTWSKTIDISYVSGFDDQSLWQEHPDITVTKKGKVYVVWEGKDSEHQNQQIKLSGSEDGGKSWSKWVNLQPAPEFSQSRPTIIEDKEGRLHILMYSAFNQSSQQIWHSFSDDGIKWSQWENISRSSFDARHVSATVTPQNKITAVWRAPSKDTKQSQVFISFFERDKWSPPTLVSASDLYQFFPSVGTDSSGNIYISWMESNHKADFPNESPTEGKIIIKILDPSGKEIIQQKLADNTIYPNLINQYNISSQTFLTYLEGDGDYKIRLANIKAK